MKIIGKVFIAVLRGCFGLGAIYLMNLALKSFDIAVGINFYNGILVGILGLSGYLLLYALAILDITLLS